MGSSDLARSQMLLSSKPLYKMWPLGGARGVGTVRFLWWEVHFAVVLRRLVLQVSRYIICV